MSESWKEWEGLTVAGQFPLQQFLGASDHSAVFLTRLPSGGDQRAVIKLVSADPQNAELELSRWSRAANLLHPNLIRIFQTGRCGLAGRDLLFLLMEYAEESLAQILPDRALSPAEVRVMLPPILDALSCLYRQGLVHGRLKPSNVLAIGDQIKISSDGLSRIGEPRGGRDKHSSYDPPEGISARSTQAGDAWALGITIVEALTRHSPASAVIGHAEPHIPDHLPAPFLEIVCSCLRRDPRRRATVGEIAALLEQPATAAAGSERIAASPAAHLPAREMARLEQPSPSRGTPASIVRSPVVRQWKIGLGAAAAVVALIVIPWLLSRHSEPDGTPETAAKGSPAAAPSQRSQPRPAAQSKLVAPRKEPQSLAAEPAAPAQESATRGASPENKPAKSQSSDVPAAESASLRLPPDPKPPLSSRAHGEVLEKVLPQTAQKSLDTIHGTVRVSVRLQVDPGGEVASAGFDSPGPSKFFADQALSAARRWKFRAPVVDGHGAPSVWLLRFEFTSSGVAVHLSQSSP